MIQFYKPTFGTDRRGMFFRCLRYEMGGFDPTTFWRGEKFEGRIPESVRIIVGEGSPPDFTLLPISWYVFSEQAAARIERRADNAVQFFDAPLYHHKTGKRVPGYKVLNATRKTKCFDVAKAKLRYDEQNPLKVKNVLHYAFDESLIPHNLHVFRATEYFVAMFFSKELMEDLMTGEVLRNLAFLEYGGEEVREIRRKGADR